MAALTMFIGAAIVLFHPLAGGLVLVGQVFLGDPFLFLPYLLHIVLLLVPQVFLLLLLADAFLCMHGWRHGKGENEYGDKLKEPTCHLETAANFVPGRHT